MPGTPEHTVQEYLAPVWAERKRIFILSLVSALVVLGINFLLPKYFKATAVILPETDKSKLGMLNQIAGLASLAGVNVAGGDAARLYPVILTSEAVLTAVIPHKFASERFKDSINLIQYFELDEGSAEKDMDEALKALRGSMTVTLDSKTSVVTVTMEMREPKLSADVLNTVLGELDYLLREKKATSATEQRKWIESRLEQVDDELRQAEERLKDFREKNRRVTDSPQLLLQQERLLREVQVKGTIDVELRKQAEIAKIEEIKQVSTVNVLDEGRPPVRKERPRKATNAAIAFVLVFAGVSTFFAVRSVHGSTITSYLRTLRST